MNEPVFLKAPHTFVVEEIPLFSPSGEGEHLYVWLEHAGWGTRRVLRYLREALGLREVQVGYAGLKDTHATVRQWISLQGVSPDAIQQAIHGDGIKVLEMRYHRHKLRVGKLRGNRFSLYLPGLTATHLQTLRKGRIPNRYGPQRFRGDAVERGRAWIRGGKRPRRRVERFWVSAYQAWLFQLLLERRVQEGTWDRALPGDFVRMGDRGWFRPVSAEDLPGEALPAGMLPGSRLTLATGHPGALEREVLAQEGWREADLRRWPVRGTRRPFVLPIRHVKYVGSWLTFELPPGGYATVVLSALGISWEEHLARAPEP